MVEIKVKLLSGTAIKPTKAHSTDACYDLYVDEPDVNYNEMQVIDGIPKLVNVQGIKISPHKTVKIHTGIATEIPSGYFCAVFPRSGLGANQNVRLANSTGIIDSDYRNEWVIALHNDSDTTRVISHGDRVAQFAVLPVLESNLVLTNELNETDRGSGFGSSGK